MTVRLTEWRTRLPGTYSTASRFIAAAIRGCRTSIHDSRRLIRHLLVIQANMVSEFMDYRVADLMNDFGFRRQRRRMGPL